MRMQDGGLYLELTHHEEDDEHKSHPRADRQSDFTSHILVGGMYTVIKSL